VLAPTGTIGFMMDCDTTGIEPDIALVKYKKLVGGGMLKIVNQTVPLALQKLGYTRRRSAAIIQLPRRERHHRGAPTSRPSTCRCSTARSARQGQALDPLHGPHQDDGRGAAVPLGRDQQDGQPAHRRHRRRHREGLPRVVALGLKAVAVYRDGCKRSQPLNTPKEAKKEAEAASAAAVQRVRPPVRRKLPDERRADHPQVLIAGHEGYITVGMYEDGSPVRSSSPWRRKARPSRV
jgi:ribonucleoside-diphosphate reductase alpha chain